MTFGIALYLLTLGLPLTVHAELVVIVNNENVADISVTMIRRIFLGKTKRFPGGGVAVPLDQDEGAVDRGVFHTKVLNKSGSQLKAYWSKLVFTGKGTPPKGISTAQEVRSMIANNPNMIGYIDSSLADDSVKVVGRF